MDLSKLGLWGANMNQRNMTVLIQTILNTKGPNHGLKIRGEIQDYMAHQVTIVLGPPPSDPFELLDYNDRYDLLMAFCKQATNIVE